MRILKIARLSTLLGLIAALPAPVFAQALNQVPAPAATQATPVAMGFSPGVRDIIKMVDAKVDPSVINAYIKNSPTAYNPSASEIIALKERGVPDEIVTTLLARGAEVRTQLARSAGPAAQTAPLTAPELAAPGYDYATAPYAYPTYADFGYGYPYYGYGYYRYPYYSSLWWDTWYPWAWYSPFCHGYYGYRYCGRYPYNGYHGYPYWGSHSYAYCGRNFGFGRPGFGYANRSAAWSPVRAGYAGHGGGYGARVGFGGGAIARGGFGGGGGARGGFSGGHSGGRR